MKIKTFLFLILGVVLLFSGCGGKIAQVPEIFSTRNGNFLICNVDGVEKDFRNLDFSVEVIVDSNNLFWHSLQGVLGLEKFRISWFGDNDIGEFYGNNVKKVNHTFYQELCDADGVCEKSPSDSFQAFAVADMGYENDSLENGEEIMEFYDPFNRDLGEINSSNVKIVVFASNNGVFEASASGTLMNYSTSLNVHPDKGGIIYPLENDIRKIKKIECYFRIDKTEKGQDDQTQIKIKR